MSIYFPQLVVVVSASFTHADWKLEVRHVFLETSWLFAVAAPSYQRTPAAIELLNLAKEGHIKIYVPACCIQEAKHTIRTKFQPKEADRLGAFVRWAVEQSVLDDKTAESARVMLSTFQGRVTAELDCLKDTLRDITSAAGVEVLPLDDAMLKMSIDLQFTEIKLDTFDRAILTAVLTKGRELRDGGATDVFFCTRDSDLLPWEKKTGRLLDELKKLYDDAGVWVYSDFTLASPLRPGDSGQATGS
jgi:hypothetical protein